MYTAEYLITLFKRKEWAVSDILRWHKVLEACYSEVGLFARAPGGKDPEAPDDFYGVAAACQVFACRELAEDVIDYGWKHYGSYNVPTPDRFSWASFMVRQPQLISAFYAAANRGRYNPVIWFLNFITAIIIATSCIGIDPKTNTDARRLCWLLIQAVTPVSWTCKLAAKVWFRRLRRDYPNAPDGQAMRSVAALYYEPGHPLGKYFMD
jgi:hypothetical protein